MASAPRTPVAAILQGGLFAGVFDIADAFFIAGLRGVSPPRVLRYIASGLVGPAAIKGGLGMAALGFLLHFLIATGAATVYVVASRRLTVLVRRPVVCGLAFGIGVYVFMHYVVLPLSLVTRGGGPQTTILLINALGIHALGVGLPIALVAARLNGGANHLRQGYGGPPKLHAKAEASPRMDGGPAGSER